MYLCEAEKVPSEEEEFLQDQRTVRLMFIGNVDRVASEKLKKRQDRKVRENTSRAKRALEFSSDQQRLVCGVISSESSDAEVELATKITEVQEKTDSEYENKTFASSGARRRSKQMRKSLPKVAKLCDRFCVSDRAGAAIATAVLEDFGIVSQDEPTNVIDRYKLRRERKLARDRCEHSAHPVQTLYFDGRKDRTLKVEKNGSRWYRKVMTEEHITLLSEPGGTFLSHLTPESSSARGIVECISRYYDDSGLDITQILGIGCDGTAANTGAIGGIIRLLEVKLGKPIQWLPCILHATELPLRHLMKHLDGRTSGPTGFSGPIGSALAKCELLPLCQFDAVHTELPVVIPEDLSTDQRYLYEMCKSVDAGCCPEELSRRNPGKMAHSRWLTTANRVLRLYVSTKNPSASLKMLVAFVVQVYAPVWFAVKSKPSCKDGARHVWLMVHLSRSLPPEVKAVIDPIIQRNAYFAHPENLLLAMVTDERHHIKQLGLRRILKARQQMRTGVRKFCVPTINFDSADYVDLINWMETDVTVPPLLSPIPTSEISSRILDKNDASLSFIQVPCHTQAMERHVKLVTEASQSVCGKRARDGYIKNRIESRRQMAAFNQKTDYCFN